MSKNVQQTFQKTNMRTNLHKMETEPSMRYESKEQMLQLAVDTIERAYQPLDQWFTVFLYFKCSA